jgi:2-oxoisovalerate dehydrogenase E2 component (dihydrolipoyl transacylase)
MQSKEREATVAMPQLGETVTEGTVSQWLKRVGDTVEKYEPIVEIATDKVAAEIPSPVSGRIRELLVKEGQTVPTGAPIAVIDTSDAMVGAPAVAAEPEPSERAGSVAETRVSPAVRRLAREHNVELAGMTGTGSGGRITAKDVLAASNAVPSAAPAVRPPSYSAPVAGETIPLSQARRIIAERMVESKRTTPHAWTMVEVDMTNAIRRRAAVRDAFERDHGVRLTLLPMFIYAVVEALHEYPLVNARYTDEGIYVHKEVNVGIAVALQDNLLVPVLRHAEGRSLVDLAIAVDNLVERARKSKLTADDLAGGTITVNNTGAIGSFASAPIVYGGQTAIVTMESIVKRAVVVDDETDAIAVRSMMNVCTSFDHRVLDGVTICSFLNDVKRRLEAISPTGLL